ncbi:hypothetical protein AA12717_0914 [Gluconacetobacter sacchari DSM 12717]|uniref:Uncharacterized protein n=2 Tax=Gluconacetobacter sacchari TaxID=92759 RepID=A0A7W4NPH1_9PROT|nr:hypothetical protein [Gluconacetobacter sacchari]MBB2161577.1 hypothetical protein [Gluconacetobacter sacchari]GBQ21532.1 hypothetical protein AA12717_0914 [Gluconacetobacter sacchari DSM 12717]
MIAIALDVIRKDISEWIGRNADGFGYHEIDGTFHELDPENPDLTPLFLIAADRIERREGNIGLDLAFSPSPRSITGYRLEEAAVPSVGVFSLVLDRALAAAMDCHRRVDILQLAGLVPHEG